MFATVISTTVNFFRRHCYTLSPQSVQRLGHYRLRNSILPNLYNNFLPNQIMDPPTSSLVEHAKLTKSDVSNRLEENSNRNESRWHRRGPENDYNTRKGGRGDVSNYRGRGWGRSRGRGSNMHNKAGHDRSSLQRRNISANSNAYKKKDEGRGKWKKPSNLKGLGILYPDFQSMCKECKAARYRVYAPGSNHPQIKKLPDKLQKYKSPNNSIHNSTSHAKEDSQQEMVHLFNIAKTSFLVIPNIKSLHVFAFSIFEENTSIVQAMKQYRQNPLSYETKLRNHIFPSTDDVNGCNTSNDTCWFNVICAYCMLHLEPNGFSCIRTNQSSLFKLHRIRNQSHRISSQLIHEGKSLHTDHAEYTCILSLSLLMKFKKELQNNYLQSKKKANIDTDMLQKVAHEMTHQDIPITLSKNDDLISNPDHLQMGHHLKSMLKIYSKEPQNTKDPIYLFVIVEFDDHKFTLDLPGGKRHLGESSWEGAKRETMEESSLMIDESWIVGKTERNEMNGFENLYYILEPPDLESMDSLDEGKDNFLRSNECSTDNNSTRLDQKGKLDEELPIIKMSNLSLNNNVQP